MKYRITVTTDPEAAYPQYFLEIVSSDPPLTMRPDRLTLIVEDNRKLDFFMEGSDLPSGNVTSTVASAIYL